MKNVFKNILKLTFICFLLVLSSCEKDLYEDSIQNTSKHKMRRVTIEDVPFLKPTLEKYDPNYRYLSDPNALVSKKDASDLNLELDHIIEYITANGLKSYSIPIKNEFGNENEDYYFENLHILQINGDFKAFIAKYNQTDDSKKFETPTFTGKIELLDIDHTPIDSVAFFNGQKMAPPAPPTSSNPDEDDQSGATGDSDPNPVHGWIWHFIHWLIGDPQWNGIEVVPTEDGGSDSNTTASEPDYSGVIIIFDPGGGQSANPNQNNPGGSIVIVPNQPSWPEFMNNLHMRANLICQRLEIDDPEIRNWLGTISNATISRDIYDYLLENNLTTNYYEANIFIKSIIPKIKQSAGIFTSIKPFIIERQIYDDPLDPCFKGVLAKLKNVTSCDISMILAKLGANNSVYKTVIKNEDFSPVYPARTERYDPLGFGSPLRYNYLIKVHPVYNNSTKLFKASILLHELIHAYFFSLSDDYYIGNDFTAFDDFPSLFEKYVLKTFPGDVGQAHHQEMALKYVNAIGRTLQEYNTGNPVPENEQPNSIYTDLAWGGLKEAPIFDTNFPYGSTERSRVLNRYACEGLNQQTGNEIPIGGNPCND